MLSKEPSGWTLIYPSPISFITAAKEIGIESSGWIISSPLLEKTSSLSPETLLLLLEILGIFTLLSIIASNSSNDDTKYIDKT